MAENDFKSSGKVMVNPYRVVSLFDLFHLGKKNQMQLKFTHPEAGAN